MSTQQITTDYLAVMRMNEELLDVTRQRLPDSLPENQRYVIVDMDGIQCLTSLQIVALVSWYRRLQAQKRVVSLVNVSDSLMKIFGLLRLSMYFNFHQTINAAIADLECSGGSFRCVFVQDPEVA